MGRSVLPAKLRKAERRPLPGLGACLAEQVYGLVIIARCLLPFLPSSAAALHARLGIASPRLYRDPLIVDGVKAAPQAVPFPRRTAA